MVSFNENILLFFLIMFKVGMIKNYLDDTFKDCRIFQFNPKSLPENDFNLNKKCCSS